LLDSIHASPALLLYFTHTSTYRLKAACTAMTMTRLGSLEYIIGLLFLVLVTIRSMIRPCLHIIIFPYFYNSNITCTLLDSINASPALLLDFIHADTYRFEAASTAMTMTGLGTLEYIVGILLVRLVVATLLSMIHRSRLILYLLSYGHCSDVTCTRRGQHLGSHRMIDCCPME
jgi:hypothetical protein